MRKDNITKRYFGPKETEVIARLSYEKVTIISREQFDKFFNFDSALKNQLIFRLKKKGVLTPIKKGVYIFSPLEAGPGGRNINEFQIPSILFPKGNYYVGYSTMYNYYGFTDQIFQTMYLLNTSMQRERVIEGIRFKLIKISPKRMFGLEKIKMQNSKVIVSNRERTLIDLIYFPKPVGGLREAFGILKYQIKKEKIDLKRFIKYACRFPSVSTRKRIGLILDRSGVRDNELNPLIKSIKDTSWVTLYKSNSRKGPINKKWKIIENVTSS